jgi:hypothetical protein
VPTLLQTQARRATKMATRRRPLFSCVPLVI